MPSPWEEKKGGEPETCTHIQCQKHMLATEHMGAHHVCARV